MKPEQKLKCDALLAMESAYDAMRRAQNILAPVQGVGMADIYSELADIYHDQILPLINKLERAKPTGVTKL